MNDPYRQVYPAVPVQQPQSIQNGMDYGMPWVYGITGAKAYPVRWGTSVAMMDAETYPKKKVIYIKSVDITGVPQPLKMYELTEIQPEQSTPVQKQDMDLSPVTKRLDELEKQYSSLLKRLDSISEPRRRRDVSE